MRKQGFQIRFLRFLSFDKPPTHIDFDSGLNIICGSSDTGKSFVVYSIDYMLGSGKPLKKIPELIGYCRVLLGIEASDGSSYTLERALDGGDFICYSGLHKDLLEGIEGKRLSSKHSAKSNNNLSRFLLNLTGINDCFICKNKKGQTHSLSFRNLVRLLIVKEKNIAKEISPIESGQYITRTSECSLFKFLLTGVDDTNFMINNYPENNYSKRLRDAHKNISFYFI